MTINISGISSDFIDGIKELANEGVYIGEGLAVRDERGDVFRVEKNGNEALIIYTEKSEFFRGLSLLKYASDNGISNFIKYEKRAFDSFGVMVDCSRNAVPKVTTFKQYLRIMALLGYNELQLYTEDLYEIEGEALFGYLRGKYSKSELKELVSYGKIFGITLVPCIQTLAHLNGIFRWNEYDSICDTDDILLIDEEKTYILIEKMIKTCREIFQSNKINIGMDEAHNVGRGKYYDIHGNNNKYEILLRHLNRVISICEKYDFQPMIWSDMFFRLGFDGKYYPNNIEQCIDKSISRYVPQNVKLVYWDYYHTDIKMCQHMMNMHFGLCGKDRTVFAGGLWTWSGFAPNIRFTIDTTKSAVKCAINSGLKDIFFTVWGNSGGDCSLFSTVPMLAYASCSCYGDDSFTDNYLKAITGISLEEYKKLELPNLIEDEESPQTNNISKYMLYCDPFLGIFDNLVKENKGVIFKKNAASLDFICARDNKYAYVFETIRNLCSLMEIKYDLGVRTRRIFRTGDKTLILNLCKDYDELIIRIEAFYNSVTTQWEKENKGYGFEVQDIRLGGLIQRIKHCKERLLKFCKEDIDIPELWEDIVNTVSEEDRKPGMILCNRYLKIATVAEF